MLLEQKTSLPSCFLVKEDSQHLSLRNQGRMDAEPWLTHVTVNIHPRILGIIGGDALFSGSSGDSFSYLSFYF